MTNLVGFDVLTDAYRVGVKGKCAVPVLVATTCCIADWFVTAVENLWVLAYTLKVQAGAPFHLTEDTTVSALRCLVGDDAVVV